MEAHKDEIILDKLKKIYFILPKINNKDLESNFLNILINFKNLFFLYIKKKKSFFIPINYFYEKMI
jgi:cbb3-type cytochrome oxidase subunit 1